MNTQNSADTQTTHLTIENPADTRQTWERPALRRLGANQAENSNFSPAFDDGLYYYS